MKFHLEPHLEKLRYFAAVARAGSFHTASVELGISQPSLSRAVMALESAMHCKLFERSRTGVKITAAGQLLSDFYERLSGDIEDLEQKIKHPNAFTAGSIRIGTFESLTFYLWPVLLNEIRKSSPSIAIRLISDTEPQLRAKLLNGNIQMVVEAEPQVDERIRSVVLYHDVFKVYARPGLAAHNDTIMYVPKAKSQDGRTIHEYLRSKGLSDNIMRFEFDTFSSVQELAVNGIGLAILPERLAQNRVREKKLQPVNFAGLPAHGFGDHRICASYLEENREDGRVKFMMNQLRTFRKRH